METVVRLAENVALQDLTPNVSVQGYRKVTHGNREIRRHRDTGQSRV